MKMSEMALKTVDQRVSPRVPVGTPASLRWGEERISGEIESINLNGMYVNSPRVPELGEYVDMVFSLPDSSRSFRVRASVVHTLARESRTGFGARFERPPLGFLEAIRGL
ncbi:MAG TPA: PilZ domain-containing protein [Thermoanaerobaculia bacterium]|nr:PilZ domain-containing protein [Thermoanaerobaculia bacterium]